MERLLHELPPRIKPIADRRQIQALNPGPFQTKGNRLPGKPGVELLACKPLLLGSSDHVPIIDEHGRRFVPAVANDPKGIRHAGFYSSRRCKTQCLKAGRAVLSAPREVGPANTCHSPLVTR
jgi:hypothetical protein